MPQHSEATKGSSTYSKNQKLRSASDQNDCKTEPCECCSLHRLPPWIAEFHGLPEVIRSRTLAYRLFWCTVIISCMSFGGYAIYEVVAEFIESPSAASITIEPVWIWVLFDKNFYLVNFEAFFTNVLDTIPSEMVSEDKQILNRVYKRKVSTPKKAVWDFYDFVP